MCDVVAVDVVNETIERRRMDCINFINNDLNVFLSDVNGNFRDKKNLFFIFFLFAVCAPSSSKRIQIVFYNLLLFVLFVPSPREMGFVNFCHRLVFCIAHTHSQHTRHTLHFVAQMEWPGLFNWYIGMLNALGVSARASLRVRQNVCSKSKRSRKLYERVDSRWWNNIVCKKKCTAIYGLEWSWARFQLVTCTHTRHGGNAANQFAVVLCVCECARARVQKLRKWENFIYSWLCLRFFFVRSFVFSIVCSFVRLFISQNIYISECCLRMSREVSVCVCVCANVT